MRKLVSAFALSAMLVAMLGVVVRAQDKATTYTGWISDNNCGAKGMSADHRSCAVKCVNERGAKWTFVDTATKTVRNIENQDSVNADKDLGQEVNVTGHLTQDGSIHIDSIAPAK